MTPTEAQQHALDTLEQLGSKPVVLRENAQLPNQAKIHIASAAEPAHVLTYQSSAAAELPYLVCFQCGLAERALQAAPDERFNVASTSESYPPRWQVRRPIDVAIPGHLERRREPQ